MRTLLVVALILIGCEGTPRQAAPQNLFGLRMPPCPSESWSFTYTQVDENYVQFHGLPECVRHEGEQPFNR